MDFFNALPLDMKMLVVGILGCVALAVFSGNRKSEKRWMVVLVLLTGVGVYRFTHAPVPHQAVSSNEPAFRGQPVKSSPKPVPLVSTSAK